VKRGKASLHPFFLKEKVLAGLRDTSYPLNNWVGGKLLKLISYERNKTGIT